MTGFSMYPTHLSDDEVALGFRHLLIVNERRDFAGQPNLITVVAREIGPMDLVVKVQDPNGRVEYSHRQFSDFGNGGDPEWNPVLAPNPSAEDAIRNAHLCIDEGVARQLGSRMDPVFPSMQLECPSCDGEISLARGFLITSESVGCNSCKRSRPASEYVRYQD